MLQRDSTDGESLRLFHQGMPEVCPEKGRSSNATERIRGKAFTSCEALSQDDTDNIIGRVGEIYDYDEEKLAVMMMPDPPRRGLWVRCRAKFLALGMTVVQNGDQEGAAIFEPTNHEQAIAAIQTIRAKKGQKLNPERRAMLLAAGRATQIKPGQMAQNGL